MPREAASAVWIAAVAIAAGCAAPVTPPARSRATVPVPPMAPTFVPALDAGAPAPPLPPAPPKLARLVVVAGGDVELARAMGKVLLRDPSHDPWKTIAPLLTTGDVRFANLESQLSDQGGVTMSTDNPLVFVGPPAGADALARGRFTIVSTANNHAWDYGKRAFLETLDNLDRVGVLHVGTGRTHEEAVRAVVVELGGFRVAFLAVTDIWNQGPLEKHPAKDLVAKADADTLAARVAELKKDPTVDAVLVSYHGGDEYQDAPTQRTRTMLRAAIDAGADAILGHHVHVVQGIEWRRGRPILYSMGNLLMQRHRDIPATGYGYLARLTLTRAERPRLEVCPYRIVGLAPIPFAGDPGRAVLERAFFSRLRNVSALVGSRPAIAASGADGCAEVSAPPE